MLTYAKFAYTQILVMGTQLKIALVSYVCEYNETVLFICKNILNLQISWICALFLLSVYNVCVTPLFDIVIQKF